MPAWAASAAMKAVCLWSEAKVKAAGLAADPIVFEDTPKMNRDTVRSLRASVRREVLAYGLRYTDKQNAESE
jgi:hypothetical protein